MKAQLVISMLLLTNSVHAQQCDSIVGEGVNCIDTAGLKRGLWLEGRREVRATVHEGYGSKDGCQHHEDFTWIVRAEGSYVGGLRTGTWCYYEEVPHRQGELRYRLEFGPEETLLGGEVFLKHGGTVKLSCVNGNCLFLGSGEAANVPFSDPDFDYEVTRLMAGTYDRALGLTHCDQ